VIQRTFLGHEASYARETGRCTPPDRAPLKRSGIRAPMDLHQHGQMRGPPRLARAARVLATWLSISYHHGA